MKNLYEILPSDYDSYCDEFINLTVVEGDRSNVFQETTNDGVDVILTAPDHGTSVVSFDMDKIIDSK